MMDSLAESGDHQHQHPQNDDNDDNETTALNNEQQNNDNDNENAILALARRLRCLFGVITWPIVPLGTLVALALVYFLYAAFFLRNDGTPFWTRTNSPSLPPCAHPLRAYALASLLWGLYAPYHRRLRARLMGSSTGDASSSTSAPRRYDQIVHTLALLYVYMGITLLQTCAQDMDHTAAGDAVEVTNESEGNNNNNNPDEAAPLNSCQATCPVLADAAQLYVTALELFTLSLVLPLLFLPCIYLWFLRQATANQEALAALRQRLRDADGGDFSGSDDDDTHDFIFGPGSPFAGTAATRRRGGSPLSAEHILRQMTRVKLVQEQPDGNLRVVSTTAAAGQQPNDPAESVENLTATTTTTTTWEAKEEGARECCICMSEFYIYNSVNDNSHDIETGNHAHDEEDPEAVVRTPVCGHLFHKQCIANWVGGRWEEPISSRNHRSSSDNRPPQNPRADGGTGTTSNHARSRENVDRSHEAATNNNNSGSRRERHRHRRARRTTCPLCRADLWQPTSTSSSSNGAIGRAHSYGTF